MFKHVKQLALLSLMLLLFSTQSFANGDPRMVVEVGTDEQGKLPAITEAAQLALPILWDRIVATESRELLSDSMKATPFLLRVVPHGDYIEVTFNDERVWQYLDSKQIAYLKEAPHLHLKFSMVNNSDRAMPKTAEALLDHARSVAEARGVVMDPTGPLLMANWRWLDASQVYLSVQGDSSLAGFTETRSMKAGDPLEQLQAWVEELVLKARVTPVAGMQTAETPLIVESQSGNPEFLLTIEQQASLPAQVIFEESLRQNSNVKSVQPTFLSAHSRQYRIVLNTHDSSWLTDWFQRRGMQLTMTADGWLAQ